jgi:hypothetical protein
MKAAIAGLLCLWGVSASAAAPEAWYGTWVERAASPMTLVVEPAGDATRFTYHMPPQFKPPIVMTFETKFDGKGVIVFVNGDASPEVMSIKRIDDRHTVAEWKINGKPAGSSRSEMSADGKVVRVDNDNADAATGPVGKPTQYWDKKSP